MAVEYPDVMNDITDARVRYESGSVQYLGEVPADQTPAGDVAQLDLTLQSIVDVPVDIIVRLELPKLNRRLRRLPQPLFEIRESDIRLTLGGGEVAQVTIPVYIRSHVPPGEYSLRISVQSKAMQEAMRRRPASTANQLGDIKIRYPQGLGIAQIASWGFEARKAQEQDVALVVSEAVQSPGSVAEGVDIEPHFRPLWTLEEWDLVAAARRDVNDRRALIVPELTTEAVYLPLMKGTQASFSNCGVTLHVSEAIFVAKILTYTVTHLMGRVEWQDCLLVPIFAYAQAQGQETRDVLWAVTALGYAHILELAIALSFSLVEEALGREPWEPTVQRALREFIVECLDTAAQLPGEFVYLPLILGGIAVAREVVVGREDIQASLRLLGTTKAEKASTFADPDLKELNDAFDRLLARRMRH